MRILVMNVNTSDSMTDVIGAAARRHASAGTETITLRPYFGAEAVDCNVESYLSAVAVMDRVLAYDEPYDAVVLTGFAEHGRWPLSAALGLRGGAAAGTAGQAGDRTREGQSGGRPR